MREVNLGVNGQVWLGKGRSCDRVSIAEPMPLNVWGEHQIAKHGGIRLKTFQSHKHRNHGCETIKLRWATVNAFRGRSQESHRPEHPNDQVAIIHGV